MGALAEELALGREAGSVPAPAVPRAPAALGVLMVDGCLLRFRGKDWGRRKASETHVEWHELKLGVCFASDGEAASAPGRRVLAQKRVVGTQGTAEELGRRLHWEAQAMGLGTAARRRFVGDGAAWIWKLAAQRWPGAEEVLDFYHAGQHLHALDEALGGEGAGQGRRARRWRHRLRHGSKELLLKELGELEAPDGEAGQVVEREKAYFQGHQGRMDYRELARNGPIGSGSVESSCRSLQCRFKRTGQFWTRPGLAHLCALREARANEHWNELWLAASHPR